MRLVVLVALLAPLWLVLAGCGGDNLSLCDGCATPTPQASLTQTPTPSTTAGTTAAPTESPSAVATP